MTQIPLSIVTFLIKFGELRFTPWMFLYSRAEVLDFLLPSPINSNVIATSWHLSATPRNDRMEIV